MKRRRTSDQEINNMAQNLQMDIIRFFTFTDKEIDAAIQLIHLSTTTSTCNAVPFSHHHHHLEHDKLQQRQEQEENNGLNEEAGDDDHLKTSHHFMEILEEEESAELPRPAKKKLRIRPIVDIYRTTKPYSDISIIIHTKTKALVS